MCLNSAKWIWQNTGDHADEYVEFLEKIPYEGGNITIKLSCDSNYACYINGKLATFGQYADYPWYKVYDEVDITAHLQEGENEIKLLVWYFGDDFLTYYKHKPGLIYTIEKEGVEVAYSSENTLCRLAPDYLQHREKKITFQMGYSFLYDTRPCDAPWEKAVAVSGLPETLYARPIEKLYLGDRLVGKEVKPRIYDLGKECVGFFFIRFKAEAGKKITVCYGEHLADGKVRRKIKDGDFKTDKDYSIGYRDFSFEIIANGESVYYMNPFRRLGCRYIEIEEEGIEIEAIGVVETPYPVNVLPFDAGSPLRQRIYDTSVRTLQINMHEHYEDTPWREQGLYTMDSRNQMISGYYAFKEYKFPRASLELMALDRRKDGLLSSCFPSSINLALPAFTLYWFQQMREYIEYSGDITLAQTHYDKLNQTLYAFVNRMENGLVPNFYGGPWYFNFYEWSEGQEGNLAGTDEKQFDMLLNCVLSMAFGNMQTICERIGKPFLFAGMQEKLNARIRKVYKHEDGLYHTSELGNAFAIVCGAATGKDAEFLAEKLVDSNSGLVHITLSMEVFKYDALLKVDKEKYREFILNDIDTRYESMLARGATSFWETDLGEADFNGAGSLSHGWSAIPVYYYHLLLNNKN